MNLNLIRTRGNNSHSNKKASHFLKFNFLIYVCFSSFYFKSLTNFYAKNSYKCSKIFRMTNFILSDRDRFRVRFQNLSGQWKLKNFLSYEDALKIRFLSHNVCYFNIKCYYLGYIMLYVEVSDLGIH